MSNSRFFQLSGLIFAIALGIRFYHLQSTPYTSDETYELRHLSTNVLEIARDTDGFPPLFRWLLSHWCHLTGEQYARYFVSLIGLLAVIPIALSARLLGGNVAACNAMLIAAISAHQIDFSQQCRAYSLVIFSVAIATYACLSLWKKESFWGWVGLVLSCFIALGTHYFVGLFVIQVWLFLLWVKWPTHFYRWLSAAVVYVVVCIPWILCLKIDFENPPPSDVINPFDLTGFFYFYYSLFNGWCIGPSSVALQELPKQEAIRRIAGWALLSFASTGVLAYHGTRLLLKPAAAWLSSMLLVTPLVAGVLATAVATSFASRYLVYLAVPLALLVGAGVQWQGRSIYVLATYVFVAINLMSTYNRHFESRYQRENYRELAQYLSADVERPFVIFLSHYMGYAAERELDKSIPYHFFAIGSDEPRDWDEKIATLILELEKDRKILVVTDWLNPGNPRIAERDQLLLPIRASHTRRISNTIDVFETTAGNLSIEKPSAQKSNSPEN